MSDLKELILRKFDLRMLGQKTLGEEDDMSIIKSGQEQKSEIFESVKAALSRMDKLHDVDSEWRITSHRKFIGKIIVFYKRFIRKSVHWYISPRAKQQSYFNSQVIETISNLVNWVTMQQNEIVCLRYDLQEQGILTRTLESNYTNIKVLTEAVNAELQDQKVLSADLEATITVLQFLYDDLKSRMELMSTQLEAVLETQRSSFSEIESHIASNQTLILGNNTKFGSLQEYINEILNQTKNEKEALESNTIQLVAHEQIYTSHQKWIDTYQPHILRFIHEFPPLQSRVADDLTKIMNDLGYLKFKINDMVKAELLVNKPTTGLPEQKESGASYASLDYFLFENAFRGSRESIKNSQEKYLTYFEGRNNVVDLGCGRGEFLELLKEAGIEARGVDLYVDYVKYTRDLGFDVEEEDALSFLQKQPDDSLGGIMLCQIVEHLNDGYVRELIKTARNKLKSGCNIVIETQNPTSLAIYSKAFYIDPTHIRPVHPLTLRYYFESFGYVNNELLFSNKCIEEFPAFRSDAINNLVEINEAVSHMNKLLYGYQDYAIIATK